MFRTYSLQEAAETLGINRHSFPILREQGMLMGIRTGKEWRYSEQELVEFWETYKGMDVSNAEKIRIAATIKRHETQATGGNKKR